MIKVYHKDGKVSVFDKDCEIREQEHGITIMFKEVRTVIHKKTVGRWWWKKEIEEVRHPWNMQCLLYLPFENLSSVERKA